MASARRPELAPAIACALALLAVGGPARAQQDEDSLPPGHPEIGSTNPHERAGKSAGSMPGVFEPPEDTEHEDATLPPGTIAVELHDADDRPVAGESLTLGVLVNSIAKGDSRKHLQATTDASGRAVFAGLETASNIAYRVSCGYQGGSFAASPFQLGSAKSMRVVLHVYPVSRSLDGVLMVGEAAVAAELRDDRIQVEEAMTIYNLGRTAWQPEDVHIAMPDGYTAFNAQASMSDQGVDDAGGSARLRGTFAPGRHSVQFRWQLPWSGDKDVEFEVGLIPHVAIARVMMPATAAVKLEVSGFPPAEARHDSQNQSFLVTERRMRPEDPRLTSLSVAIRDLPTRGAGPLVAVLLSAVGVLAGLASAARARSGRRGAPGREVTAAQQALLEELAELERARAGGTVGPRTYDRARRELMQSLAELVLVASHGVTAAASRA